MNSHRFISADFGSAERRRGLWCTWPSGKMTEVAGKGASLRTSAETAPDAMRALATAGELGFEATGLAPTRNVLRCLSVLQGGDAKWKSTRSVGLQPSS